jgi:hypothetical protein
LKIVVKAVHQQTSKNYYEEQRKACLAEDTASLPKCHKKD